MLKLIFISTLFLLPAAPQAANSPQPVELFIQEEIPSEILEELFILAAVDWNTTTADLWIQYKDGGLTVEKLPEPYVYRLTSTVHGSLDLILDDDF